VEDHFLDENDYLNASMKILPLPKRELERLELIKIVEGFAEGLGEAE